VRINLHIDQIVVEGTNLTRRQRELLAAAIEAELTSQLRRRAGTPERAAGGLGANIAGQILAAIPLPAGPRR
jgi:hypothetical protein